MAFRMESLIERANVPWLISSFRHSPYQQRFSNDWLFVGIIHRSLWFLIAKGQLCWPSTFLFYWPERVVEQTVAFPVISTAWNLCVVNLTKCQILTTHWNAYCVLLNKGGEKEYSFKRGQHINRRHECDDFFSQGKSYLYLEPFRNTWLKHNTIRDFSDLVMELMTWLFRICLPGTTWVCVITTAVTNNKHVDDNWTSYEVS